MRTLEPRLQSRRSVVDSLDAEAMTAEIFADQPAQLDVVIHHEDRLAGGVMEIRHVRTHRVSKLSHPCRIRPETR